MNTLIFINKAKSVHKDKYNYSLVEYINALTKIKIICNKCNIIFEQNPYNHLNGQGCKVCIDNDQRFTIETFIKKSKELFNNFDYTLTKYINAKTKLKIQCKYCKTIYEQLPRYHLNGIGCKCQKTIDIIASYKFINKAKEIHNDKFDYTQIIYINSKTKITIKCNTCKIIFEQQPYSHLKGYGCNNCSINNRKLTTQCFINKAKEIHNDKYNYDLTNYLSTNEIVNIKCNSCNKIFEQIAGLHLSGSGGCLCNYYEELRLKYEKEFYIKAKKIHNNKYIYDLVEYFNTNTKIKIICKKCKKIFEQSPNKHLQGKGCSYCNFSKGELKCEEILEYIEYVKEVIPQFRFDNCRNIYPLPFDFKVILNNCKYFLIEYQGIQHYESTTFFSHEKLEDIQKRDKIKYDYCKNNNIDLLVIKYTDFNNIEHIITNFIKKVI